MPRAPRRTKKKISALHRPIDAFEPIRADADGFALLSASILMGVILAFSLVLLNASLNTRFVGKVFEQSLSAEQIAEAGLHQALFCVNATSGTNCGGTYGSSYAGQSNVTMGSGKFTTTMSGSSSSKTITSVGTSGTGQTKTVKIDITSAASTTSVTIPAAVQAGAGGIQMTNSAEIVGDNDADGDVISEGDITCSNSATMKSHVLITRSGGKIDSCTITKNAYADILTNDKITGNAYYKTNPSGISGSTVTGTKYPNSATPTAVSMPNLDIAGWKSYVTGQTGTTHSGAYNINGSSVSHITDVKITGNLNLSNSAVVTVDGPLYITGDVILSNSSVLTLNGPLYMTGNFSFSNSSIVKLSSGYGANSGLIIADGTMTLSNSCDLQGSGTAGSAIVVATTNTNTSSPAISVSNSSSGAILYAPYGYIQMSNSASVPAAVGYKVSMSNSTKVNSNGINLFSVPLNVATSGSAGTGWHITSSTWREFK